MGQAQTNGMARERDDRGRVKETYPLDEVYASLEEIGPASTTDVMESLDSSYETAYQKLRELEDNDLVSSTRVGNARLWSVSDRRVSGEH